MISIEAKGLCKRYGQIEAVKCLDLCVGEGEMLALLGVNGAGKTTAIKMLSCLTPPDAGDALLCGHSIRTEAQQVKQIINVSPQDTAVAKKLSVRENLQFIAEIHGFSKEEARKRVQKMMDEMQLCDVAEQRAGTLSGGWQRRLSIAMALISEPKILFLDEPTLGLDVLARADLWEIIRALKGKTTILLTTHYMEEAEALSDRIAIMKDGRLLLTDTPAALLEKTGAKNIEEAFIAVVRGAGQ